MWATTYFAESGAPGPTVATEHYSTLVLPIPFEVLDALRSGTRLAASGDGGSRARG